MRRLVRTIGFCALTLVAAPRAGADFLLFDSGSPDGKMATTSRPGAGGKIETESADGFITNGFAVNSAKLTGLRTGESPTVGQVVVEIYRVFPNDSSNPPSGNVPTRVNSPCRPHVRPDVQRLVLAVRRAQAVVLGLDVLRRRGPGRPVGAAPARLTTRRFGSITNP